jgi:hypothetical protein
MFDSQNLPDGLIVIVKEDCETCQLVLPVLDQLASSNLAVQIYSQDNPAFPPAMGPHDDRDLAVSFGLNIEIVPTLIRRESGQEVDRTHGWSRSDWESVSGLAGLGPDLTAYKPGCSARNLEPGIHENLRVKYGDLSFSARKIIVQEPEDEIEAIYARGWTDGLPVVPPTPVRVLRMLDGSRREPEDILGTFPHNLAEVTVEKVAINAVMAGCTPEFFPVVLAAVEAACDPDYGLQGFTSSTWFSTPIVVVNGPIIRQIGMESGFSALGAGSRANATIGRALNLVIRNINGARPGEVARSTMGNPARFSFCFAENLENSSWLSFGQENGGDPATSMVTVLAGDGLQPVMDQKSRQPASLASSLAESLKAVVHPKLVLASDVLILISPEHSTVFESTGWTKADLRTALVERLQLNTADLVRGAGGITEGISPELAAEHETLAKLSPENIFIARVGSNAGLFSAIVGLWPVGGTRGTQPITRPVIGPTNLSEDLA